MRAMLVVVVWMIRIVFGEPDDDCKHSDMDCIKATWDKSTKGNDYDVSPMTNYFHYIMSSQKLAIVLFTLVIGVVIMNIIVYSSCNKLHFNRRKKSGIHLV
eukprot:316345_1